MTELVDYSKINEYLTTLVPERPVEMQTMEAYADETGFPIIGPTCGYLCYQVARMIKARFIFEMGSGYGYSTAWFARAVVENGGGKVHHVVWDNDLSHQARLHLDALGFSGVITYHVSEAIESLQRLPGQFDLIFNDIDKECYPESLATIREKLRPGGVLIVDNLLWHGQVLDPDDHDPSTQGVRELTRLLTRDAGWISSLIPIRDGVLMALRQ